MVPICPILHGDLVEGFHASRTDLDVPGKKKYFHDQTPKYRKIFLFSESFQYTWGQKSKFSNKTTGI